MKIGWIKSERGVGIMEALVVTVIVALAGMAFLTLVENQNIFVKRTRQTNARDQLNFFLQGLIRDRSLLLFSAQHPANTKLRECLGDLEKKIEPKCEYGKVQGLYLIDLTDPKFEKVWTAPPATPVLYDEFGQGCDPKIQNVESCRFEVASTFQATCPNNAETCKRPDRLVVNFTLKQITSKDKNVTPLTLRGTNVSFAHALSYNTPPVVGALPTEVHLSQANGGRSIEVAVSNENPDQKLLWALCESTDRSVLIQCLPTNNAGKMAITLRLSSWEVPHALKIRFQMANTGPAPNASKVFEIPVYVDAVCLTPWGDFVEEGATILAYDYLLVNVSDECTPNARTCRAGVLSNKGRFKTCGQRQPANCTSPWSEVIPHGQSRNAFATPTVPYGTQCAQETRICSDGVLTGSGQFNSCTVAPPLNCKTPWGADLGHGLSVLAYSVANVPFNRDCGSVQQTRMCNNGTLTGTAEFSLPNCTVLPPRRCFTPWGQEIQHGGSVEAYYLSLVNFGQSCRALGAVETRVCNDGTLSGSFTQSNCTMRGP
jgi:hypothetical protein